MNPDLLIGLVLTAAAFIVPVAALTIDTLICKHRARQAR